MFNDIRLAARKLTRSPGFTLTALATLALCIGANLAIFAVVDAILVRPLPFRDSGRLVTIFNSYPRAGKPRDGASLTSYYERRGQIPAFSSMAALSFSSSIVGEAGSTQREDLARVSPEFFETLGVAPAMGRVFTDAEMTYQTDHVAILTHEYWRDQFGSDPKILGRSIRTDGLSRTIVGVMPPGFHFLSSKARFFMPLSSEEGERNLEARHHGSTTQIARLRDGATLAEAQAQIDAHNAAHAAEFPYAKEVAASGFHSIVAQLHADHVAPVRPTLLLLQAGALFLLLIGCVNLVNLLLIRAAGQSKELAIRQSMGAGARHIVGLVLMETVMLTLAGGLCGLIVGAWGIRLMALLGANQLPLGAEISFDVRVAAAALGVSAVLGAAIAVPVAWFNLRRNPAGALKSESRGGTASRAAQRIRHGFIVVQIASAFVLLAGAGLLALSLKRVMEVSPGFRADHVITGQFSLPWNSYRTGEAFLGFADKLAEAAGRQPGIFSVGVVTNVPVHDDGRNDALTAVGYKPAPGESVVLHREYGVFGDYFKAMGIPLREGRYLTTADSRTKEVNCVVDEVFARRYWPKGGAVGQQITAVGSHGLYTVVGVVGSVKGADLAEKGSNGSVYFPFLYVFQRDFFIVARTGLPPEAFALTLGKLIREADPEIPVSSLRTMEGRIEDDLVARRSPALLGGIFAAVALLLASIGTYGVLAYAVEQRRREIGVRMALGALPSQILSQFLVLGMRLLAIGTVIGFAGAWIAGRAMRGLLFDVPALPLATLGFTALLMGAASLAACLIPSRRASRISPLEALSSD